MQNKNYIIRNGNNRRKFATIGISPYVDEEIYEDDNDPISDTSLFPADWIKSKAQGYIQEFLRIDRKGICISGSNHFQPKTYVRKSLDTGNMMLCDPMASYSVYRSGLERFNGGDFFELEDRTFLDNLLKFYAQEEKSKGISLVYDHFGKIIAKKDFKRGEKILIEVYKYKFTSWVLLPFLTITRRYKNDVPSRADLFSYAVCQFVDTMSPDQVKSTVKRLS